MCDPRLALSCRVTLSVQHFQCSAGSFQNSVLLLYFREGNNMCGYRKLRQLAHGLVQYGTLCVTTMVLQLEVLLMQQSSLRCSSCLSNSDVMLMQECSLRFSS